MYLFSLVNEDHLVYVNGSMDSTNERLQTLLRTLNFDQGHQLRLEQNRLGSSQQQTAKSLLAKNIASKSPVRNVKKLDHGRKFVKNETPLTEEDRHETAEQMMARKWRQYFGHCTFLVTNLDQIFEILNSFDWLIFSQSLPSRTY